MTTNKKCELLKLLEERRLIEEAELTLIEELYNNDANDTNDANKLKKVELFMPVSCKKERSKDIKISQERKRKELQEKQKQQSQKQSEKKQQQQKYRELYGEAKLDEYDEIYGYIEDKY